MAPDDRRTLVLAVLAEHPGLTADEVAVQALLGRRHATMLLLGLAERGDVVAEGRRWFPAPR